LRERKQKKKKKKKMKKMKKKKKKQTNKQPEGERERESESKAAKSLAIPSSWRTIYHVSHNGNLLFSGVAAASYPTALLQQLPSPPLGCRLAQLLRLWWHYYYSF
jgi:uncharacterized membrane protein YdbT with pleckstrin-like domain